jgi:hypothetical protein
MANDSQAVSAIKDGVASVGIPAIVKRLTDNNLLVAASVVGVGVFMPEFIASVTLRKLGISHPYWSTETGDGGLKMWHAGDETLPLNYSWERVIVEDEETESAEQTVVV